MVTVQKTHKVLQRSNLLQFRRKNTYFRFLRQMAKRLRMSSVSHQNLRVLPTSLSSDSLLALYHHTRDARHPMDSPCSEACQVQTRWKHCLGHCWEAERALERALIYPKCSDQSMRWLLRTISFESSPVFFGQEADKVCKITKTPLSRFRDQELPNAWGPKHPAVPPSSEKWSEIRVLLSILVFPKSLELL